jgi:prepilin-type N-terminal cleavage/methylation domain-containing protein
MRNSVTKYSGGFTLLEVLVVIGLFAVVAGLVLTVGSHTHSGFNTQDDTDLLIATLQKARSQSINGVCVGVHCTVAAAHGVHVDPRSIVLFQGTTYNASDATNEYIQAESNATTFSGSNIIFMPLSGNTNTTNTITILDASTVVSVITVGPDGQLTWSH